ncbi:sensor histidine kinase [Lachnotalea glycerini]|uniref:histidine kinase n=1 Tax=Lachnotalea glycerini TaxID=1763509 RepID=A0A371JH57_9FIRM|nr:sensor histidine kinase [Lachnotalea glycerini]RDY32070.1 sensor histidine kinase [Lachnotalea glycerini]
MKKRAQKNKSMFLHLTIAFMLIGLLPLVIIGSIFVKRYSDNIKDLIISNASSQSLYISKNIESMLSELDETLRYPYDYNSDEYTYFYQLLKDESLTSAQLANKIETVLNTMLYMDTYIEGVRFIDNNNKLYCIYRDPTKSIYGKVMLMDKLQSDNTNIYKKLQFFATYAESKYYYPSKQYDFTVARFYMDTSTVAAANNTVLGTVYLDVNINKILSFIKDIQLYEESKFYIVDKNSGSYIYSADYEDYGTTFDDRKEINTKSDQNYIQKQDCFIVYQDISNSPWMVVTKIYNKDIYKIYKVNIVYFSIILICTSTLLIIINLLSSRKISKPARELKNVMVEIENGNLDIRAQNCSKDEMGFLADGLNNMMDNLQNYIKKVYVAELRQKEAQLNALKTQISPHYLYNTLDVIRMTALANHDEKTALMLDSLSSQLQYLIGQSSDMVLLSKELENIREYLVIVKIRYENHLDLEINVNKEDMELYVMKLLLQPIVENSVKHGFVNKRDVGKISIKAIRKTDYLEITVMDDGIGMSEEKLQEINALLASERIGHKTEDGWSGIGLKNVYDRIKNNYGNAYGFEITSCEKLGTIVRYKLPIRLT